MRAHLCVCVLFLVTVWASRRHILDMSALILLFDITLLSLTNSVGLCQLVLACKYFNTFVCVKAQAPLCTYRERERD